MLGGRLESRPTRSEPQASEVHELGDTAPSDTADTTIRVDAQAYRELREGKLEPQEAFLAGKIAVEGDMQRAMQLALAVLSPD